MQRHIRLIYLLLIISAFAECRKSQTDIKVCEKEYGAMVGKKHYLSADFVTEDGKLDYHALNKYNRKNKKYLPDPDCIPLRETPTTEEKLYDKETEVSR